MISKAGFTRQDYNASIGRLNCLTVFVAEAPQKTIFEFGRVCWSDLAFEMDQEVLSHGIETAHPSKHRVARLIFDGCGEWMIVIDEHVDFTGLSGLSEEIQIRLRHPFRVVETKDVWADIDDAWRDWLRAYFLRLGLSHRVIERSRSRDLCDLQRA